MKHITQESTINLLRKSDFVYNRKWILLNSYSGPSEKNLVKALNAAPRASPIVQSTCKQSLRKNIKRIPRFLWNWILFEKHKPIESILVKRLALLCVIIISRYCRDWLWKSLSKLLGAFLLVLRKLILNNNLICIRFVLIIFHFIRKLYFGAQLWVER